jgi:hypothetical protein
MRLAIMLIISTGKFTLLFVWCAIGFVHFICNLQHDLCFLHLTKSNLLFVFSMVGWLMENDECPLCRENYLEASA